MCTHNFFSLFETENQVSLFVRQEPKYNGTWKKGKKKTNLTQTNVERGARVSEKKESWIVNQSFGEELANNSVEEKYFFPLSLCNRNKNQMLGKAICNSTQCLRRKVTQNNNTRLSFPTQNARNKNIFIFCFLLNTHQNLRPRHGHYLFS